MNSSLYPYLRSGKHLVLMIVFFLAVFFPCLSKELIPASLIILVACFISICGKRMLYFILTAVVVGGLCALFPILAPVAWIIMLIMFYRRISYIWDNIRAVLAGFYLYGAVAFAILYGEDIAWILPFDHTMVSAFLALAATVILNSIMISLYKRRYTPASAVSIMVSCPLLIILLCLPFLHALDAFEGTDSGDLGDVGHDTVNPDVHAVQSDNVIPNPGVHQVHDYFRADGTHVRGYLSTNPDGILENNFSYHGQHGIAPGGDHIVPGEHGIDTSGNINSYTYVVTQEENKKQDKQQDEK